MEKAKSARLIGLTTIVVTLMSVLSPGAAHSGISAQILTGKDTRAAAALEQAERDESLKKITRSPDSAESENASPSVIKPIILVEPAPGVAPSASTDTPSEQKSAQKPPAKDRQHASAPSDDQTPSVSAEKSLGWLTNGNTRYVKRRFRADGKVQADRTRLLKEQKPHAIILSCADSRVPPEIIFDQALGEVFTVRVAGGALDSSVIASVEYAVEHLGSRLLVVMGHTQCSAVAAALDKDSSPIRSEAFDQLVGDIRPRLNTINQDKRSANLEIESTVNADGVARDLVKRSEIIRRKVEAGELVIKPALYRMDSGKVSFY